MVRSAVEYTLPPQSHGSAAWFRRVIIRPRWMAGLTGGRWARPPEAAVQQGVPCVGLPSTVSPACRKRPCQFLSVRPGQARVRGTTYQRGTETPGRRRITMVRRGMHT